jgi:hypothetical protein
MASVAIEGLDARIDRLSATSLRRVIEPDVEMVGGVAPGAVVAPELLSIAGLGVALTSQQLAKLSREEVASFLEIGLRFEAGLISAFTLQIATASDLTSPRVVYILHEIGEETRHSRLFIRLLRQLEPEARHPLDRPFFQRLEQLGMPAMIRRSALLLILILAGEEVTDLVQNRMGEHSDTDPFIVSVNRYHRQEEARHLAFARVILPEIWEGARGDDRVAVRHLAPRLIHLIFMMLVHPGVYRTVGLPGWSTWWAANRTQQRVALRHTATRPVLASLIDAGVLQRGRIPRAWRQLCGVDRVGQPLESPSL